MAIAKIILNGVTQMDLTSDTVAASNLLSPYTAHGADGQAIVGTATGGGGTDIPTFTVTWSSDWETLVSITCDKTYAECLSRSDNDRSALCVDTNGNGTDDFTYCCSFVEAHTGYLEYVVTGGWESYYDLLYYSNGTITMVNPSAYTRESSDITVSGSTVTIPAGEYTIQEVVNVPGSNPVKTKTGTFTGNGTRQVEISCDFEPDLIYWSSDPGTSASSGTVAGIIAREMMSANRYRNNSTTNTHYAAIDITAMNTNGSSYCFRATYANSKVTLYCFSSNARSLFTNGRTYSYKFVKWTTQGTEQ